MIYYLNFHLPSIVLSGGLAAWVSLSLLNNIAAFGHNSAYLGYIMGMSGVTLPDTPDSPLMRRAVNQPNASRRALHVICVVELCVSLLFYFAFGLGVYELLGGETELFEVFTSLALTGFMGLGVLLLVSGTWFAYYIHMPEAQITHLVMVGVGLLGLVFVALE